MKLRHDYTTYTPELIDKLKKLVDKLPRAEGVKVVAKKLRLSDRRAREVYSTYLESDVVKLIGSMKKIGETTLESSKSIGKLNKVVSNDVRSIRRLFIDLETSPNIGTFWRCGYKINIGYENIIKERAIICAAYKWEGEDKTHVVTWDDNQDDKDLLEHIVEVCNDADEIVAHSGSRFDVPWIRTRCVFHNMLPLPEYKVIDTLTWCRRKFMFNSNKLDYVAKYLGLGGKIKTGFDLWKAVVLQNDKNALDKMSEYCCHDVELLESVWDRLNQLMPAKTHAGVLSGGAKWVSPYSGSSDVRLSKTRVTAGGTTQFQMIDGTGRYFTIGARAYQSYLDFKRSK